MPSKGPYHVAFKPILARTDKPLINYDLLMRELTGVSLEWSDDIISDLKMYPPPKKNGVYVRTGSLGQNWKALVERQADRLITRIVNQVRDPKTGAYYMQRVQGMKQLPMHRKTGWLNVWGVMRRYASRDFQHRVQLAIDKHIARAKAVQSAAKPINL